MKNKLVLTFLLLISSLILTSGGNMKISLEDAKAKALVYANKLGYKTDEMKIIADQDNTVWNKYYSPTLKTNFPDKAKNIENKIYFAICITPQEITLGGTVWILIDSQSGDIIEVIREK